jgi:hypothetical protein
MPDGWVGSSAATGAGAAASDMVENKELRRKKMAPKSYSDARVVDLESNFQIIVNDAAQCCRCGAEYRSALLLVRAI